MFLRFRDLDNLVIALSSLSATVSLVKAYAYGVLPVSFSILGFNTTHPPFISTGMAESIDHFHCRAAQSGNMNCRINCFSHYNKV
jgi:hypothetical protein